MASIRTMYKLQCVQNMLAHTVVQARKYDHVNPVLVELGLHWLPLEARICYKIAVMTFSVVSRKQV